MTERRIAWGRSEAEACERLTPGCSIDHAAEPTLDGTCETW